MPTPFTVTITEVTATDSTNLTVEVYISGVSENKLCYNCNILHQVDYLSDDLLKWYFDSYLHMPYNDVSVQDLPEKLKAYGTGLFNDLKLSEIIAGTNRHLTIELIGDSPLFDAILWETLWHPEDLHPLIFFDTQLVRYAKKETTDSLVIHPASTINLLLITARP